MTEKNNNDLTKTMEEIFESANHNFLIKNSLLFEQEVSERTLCGALMLELNKAISMTPFSMYYTDVEYNRNRDNKLKTINIKLIEHDEVIVPINCDLIVHSRGEIVKQDNLIAIEMKKSTANNNCKKNDKVRLECLTRDSFDNIWSYDGKTLPKHVCRYSLGIYYEINFTNKKIIIEYYKKGCLYKEYTINFKGKLILLQNS